MLATRPARRESAARGELAIVLAGFAALTVVLTYPLAFHLSTLGRANNGDGQFSIWNVAWVARTLAVDPLHVLDANIFHPHRWTLFYSESNLGAGALAMPAYWVTRNPYVAHNFVLLLSFVLSASGMYYLVRHLFHDRVAAVVAAIAFAYCPYVFVHLPHVQLLMTAGLPVSMLAFHRMVDEPGAARATLLGVMVGAQTLFCGYYAIFSALMVAFAVLAAAVIDRRLRTVRFWRAVGTAAIVAVVVALPLVLGYVTVQQATGFSRPLQAANAYSAAPRAYATSVSYAHAVLRPVAGEARGEALFPGFVAAALGVAALVHRLGGVRRGREIWTIYGGFAVLAFWISLGPRAGLYRALYAIFPLFALTRAPSRFGLIVTFALAVLAGGAVAVLRRRLSRPWLAAGLVAFAAAESLSPLSLAAVPRLEEGYRRLAALPAGPVLEIPVYSEPFAHARTQYMLASTFHWMPLVDAYSDYIPRDFIDAAPILANFPTREAFKLLERDSVRYVIFHADTLDAAVAADIRGRLRSFERHLAERYADDRIWLFEIIGYPE